MPSRSSAALSNLAKQIGMDMQLSMLLPGQPSFFNALASSYLDEGWICCKMVHNMVHQSSAIVHETQTYKTKKQRQLSSVLI